MLRQTVTLSLALLPFLVSLPARADESSSGDGQRSLGIGLGIGGLALSGVGGFLIYEANRTSSTTTGTIAIATLSTGILTLSAGVIVYLTADKPSEPKHAISIGPCGVGYVRSFVLIGINHSGLGAGRIRRI